MKKKISKKQAAKNQDESTYPDDLYYADWLNSNHKYVLTVSAEEKRKQVENLQKDKAFLKKLITDFKIDDMSKLYVFWTDLIKLTDFAYNNDDKSDDLAQIAIELDKITSLIALDNPTNMLRLGKIATEMVSTLEEYKEICASKHKRAKNHAHVARKMDALVAHVGEYLTNVLGIPFRYSETITKKEKPAADFLDRITTHLAQTGRANTRGVSEAAKRYKKKLTQAKEAQRPKVKKKPLK